MNENFENLISTYKLAYKTGGKYNFESKISSTVEMNRCITLENLYTTGNELDIDLSISYADNQLVRASDIVPKLGDGFGIYTTGYGRLTYATTDNGYSVHSINPGFFEHKLISIEHDFETNIYDITGYVPDGFDDDQASEATLYSVFFNFVSPYRYLISLGTDADTIDNRQSVCASVLQISSNIISINDSTDLSNFPIKVICRKLINNDNNSYYDIKDSIETLLKKSYSTDDLSYAAEKFTIPDTENSNTNQQGYGVSIEIGDLNYNPYANTGLKLNNGTYVSTLNINLTLSIQVLYDVSTVNDYNYNINLHIDF